MTEQIDLISVPVFDAEAEKNERYTTRFTFLPLHYEFDFTIDVCATE